MGFRTRNHPSLVCGSLPYGILHPSHPAAPRSVAAVALTQPKSCCSKTSSSKQQPVTACCETRRETTLEPVARVALCPAEDACCATIPGGAKPLRIDPITTRPVATKSCCTAQRQEPAARHGKYVVRSKKRSFSIGLSAAKCRGATWSWTHIEWVQPSTWTRNLPAESASLWVMQPLFPRLPSIDPDHPPPRGDISPV